MALPPIAKLFGFSLVLALSSLATGLSMASAETAGDAGATAWIEKARQKDLGMSLQWLNLGHYRKGWFGGYESEVAGDDFFFAENGKEDPRAELEATIRGLLSAPAQGKEQDHPVCKFPARVAWLKRELTMPDSLIPKATCELYQKYIRGLSPQSATIVFSSYFLNSPASAFGHTFLRINRSRGGAGAAESRGNELLDFGIGYAAEVTTENPVLYAIYGMAGLFRGTFTKVPYYYKVREYNDFEARDLWSYDLKLSHEELMLLVDHLWELGGTHFNYKYLTQNCSYHILTAIEAAAPRLKLTDKLPFYVIPSDTIKVAAATPDLIAGISYRPSVRSQFFHRLKHLSPEERKALDALVEARSPAAVPESLPAESKVRVLDAAADYWDYKYPDKLVDEQNQNAQEKQAILLARAKMGLKSEKLELPILAEDQPHVGHGSRRMALEGGHERGRGAFSRFDMRFALHDLLDPAPGYPEGSQIEFARLKLRYEWDRKRVELDEATMFRITSVSPLKDYNRQLSWRVNLGARKILDANCDRCVAGGFEGGPGFALEAWAPSRLLVYGFVDGEAMFSPGFRGSNFRLGAGPSAGFVLAPLERLRLSSEGGIRYHALALERRSYHWQNEARWHLSSSLALDVRYTVFPKAREGGASVMYYF